MFSFSSCTSDSSPENGEEKSYVESKSSVVSDTSLQNTESSEEAAVQSSAENSEAKKEMTLSLTYKNLSNSIRGIVTDAVSDFTMSPFGLINTAIHTERSDCTYWYSLTNTNKIKYKDFITCVGKENMKLSLALFKSDDYWVVYGFVAADAPSIFFIRKKVEAAIVERAQAFCSYFFTQLE